MRLTVEEANSEMHCVHGGDNFSQCGQQYKDAHKNGGNHVQPQLIDRATGGDPTKQNSTNTVTNAKEEH